jgi:hypothetical protein
MLCGRGTRMATFYQSLSIPMTESSTESMHEHDLEKDPGPAFKWERVNRYPLVTLARGDDFICKLTPEERDSVLTPWDYADFKGDYRDDSRRPEHLARSYWRFAYASYPHITLPGDGLRHVPVSYKNLLMALFGAESRRFVHFQTSNARFSNSPQMPRHALKQKTTVSLKTRGTSSMTCMLLECTLPSSGILCLINGQKRFRRYQRQSQSSTHTREPRRGRNQ